MELYDVNEIFIASMGYVKKDLCEAKIKKNEYVFVISSSVCTNKEFIDAISKKHYKFFSYNGCEHNDLAIFDQQNLVSFIAQKCKHNKKLQNLAIIKKIINGQSLNEIELKRLLFAVNNGNIYKTLSNMSEEIIDKKNSNIKLNYVTTLTNKKYKLQPTIGRDIEIKNVLTSLAQTNKATLLIGERGVGKTSIVDEISYRISKNDIPNFFKNKKIIELNFNLLNTNNKSITENIINIFETAKKENSILFIDGLENINNIDILNILKYEIKRNDLKVIITSNPNNISYSIFNDDIFNKIIINEPEYKDLIKIISKILDRYSIINNIKFYDSIINDLILALIELTKLENRIQSESSNKPTNYDMYNPGLVCEIIDAMFADAKANNNKILTENNILNGINSCLRIKEETKKEISKTLVFKIGFKTLESELTN